MLLLEAGSVASHWAADVCRALRPHRFHCPVSTASLGALVQRKKVYFVAGIPESDIKTLYYSR